MNNEERMRTQRWKRERWGAGWHDGPNAAFALDVRVLVRCVA